LAELYCAIWKEPPWNEEFWTVRGVSDDFLVQIRRPCAKVCLAFAGLERVVGFAWGYEVSRNNLREIAGTDALDFLFMDRERVFYVDEVGVAPGFREQKIGEQLSKSLIAAAYEDHGITRITLRTDVGAQAARSLFAKIGFKELEVRDKEHPDRTYWLLLK